MAKKTAYGTGMTIRQIRSLMRKTERMIKLTAEEGTAPPDMVMITYSAEGKWIIHEDYMDKKKILQRRITKETDSLQDYVFQRNFLGQVLLDCLEHPEGNLYSFNTGMFRAEYALVGKDFALDFVGHSEHLNGDFEIIIFEDRKEMTL